MSEASQTAAWVKAWEAWWRERALSQALSREQLDQRVQAFRADDDWWAEAKPRFEEVWERVEGALREEGRSLDGVLGEGLRQRVLDTVERLDPDPEAVRTFLHSPAVEAMLGQVLYTGISEFFRRMDILGNLINKLPVIGPIRKKVMSVFKEELDARLETKIKEFLGSFSGLAVERMVQFVLSDENQPGFRRARRSVAEHLLQRPVNTLVPAAEVTAPWRDTVWSALRKPPIADESGRIDAVYAAYGGKTVGEVLPPLPEQARAQLVEWFEEFLASEHGAPWRGALSG